MAKNNNATNIQPIFTQLYAFQTNSSAIATVIRGLQQGSCQLPGCKCNSRE